MKVDWKGVITFISEHPVCSSFFHFQDIEAVKHIYHDFHNFDFFWILPYFKAQAPDDLSVRRGDWVYADLNNQTVDGWLWAYAPKTRKYGFIPKAYARPPAMTSL